MSANLESNNADAPESRRISQTSSYNKMNPRQPLVDIVVAVTAIPSLVLFALLLETHMANEWANDTNSRWTVLGLGIGLLIISILICGYATHRMGVCLWAGPQDGSDYYSNSSRLNAEGNPEPYMDILPPSYESVMGYDIPPPPYHCIVTIESDTKDPIPKDDSTNYI